MTRRSKNMMKPNLGVEGTCNVQLRYLHPYELKAEIFLNANEKDSILDLLAIGCKYTKSANMNMSISS